MNTPSASLAQPTGTIESVRVLLSRALGRFEEGSPYPRNEELDYIVKHLNCLSAPLLAEFERTAILYRGPLSMLCGSPPHQELTKRERIVMRTVLRALRTVLENISGPHAGYGLTVDQMAMSYAEVNIVQLVRNICGQFELLARDRRLSFEVETQDALLAEVDDAKVEGILLNLLFNAFKYTPEGGQIRCVIEKPKDEEGEVLLSVLDTGPGIPLAHSEAVFDRSRQIDRSVFLQVGGVGLSLGRARDYAALHGGTLSLVPAAGGGTHFLARLPVQAFDGIHVARRDLRDTGMAVKVVEVATSELHREAELDKLPTKRTDRPVVLIVEDSRSVQRILADSLRPEFNTASAFDGLQGLRLAGELRPDLLVVDLSLPKMNGEKLIQCVRSNPLLCRIPVLVLTAEVDPIQQVRLLEAGVQDVLRKPFLVLEARARIRNLLTTKRTLDLLNTVSANQDSDPIKAASDVAEKQAELRNALTQVEVARNFAESASRTKSNFLRIVSHELRTPVTAMQLHIHLLHRDPETMKSPKVLEGITRVSQLSQRLLHLVDTMLEWARVESGRCKTFVEDLNFMEIVGDAVAGLESYANRKQIQIDWNASQTLPRLLSDERIVHLIVNNLVNRAIQLTDRGSVVVKVGAKDGFHFLSVTDRGAKIPLERVSEVFEPAGAPYETRWDAGAGLGLFVVRDIAGAIGGEIVLEESDDSVNTFTVRLPPLPDPTEEESLESGVSSVSGTSSVRVEAANSRSGNGGSVPVARGSSGETDRNRSRLSDSGVRPNG